ncbi:MAG: hypothetical protein ACTS27_00050 [Phycisphaerales bacterium]
MTAKRNPSRNRRDLTADQRRDAVATHIRWFRNEGIDEDLLAAAMGMSTGHLHRLIAEATSPRRDAEQSAVSFLNDRVITTLKGLRELVDHFPRARKLRGDAYMDYVVAELDQLQEGDIHSLATCLPPLERDASRIRRAIISAAARGVEFNYYLLHDSPAQAFLKSIEEGKRQEANDAGDNKALQKELDERKEAVDNTFNWLRNATVHASLVLNAMLGEAARMDLDELGHFDLTSSERCQLVSNPDSVQRDNVAGKPRKGVWFYWLKTPWLGLNEKIVYVTFADKNRKRVIRKEILDTDYMNQSRPFELQDQQWTLIDYDVSEDLLKGLMRTSRERITSEEILKFYRGISQ